MMEIFQHHTKYKAHLCSLDLVMSVLIKDVNFTTGSMHAYQSLYIGPCTTQIANEE